ncbi:MAG: trigger factor, partial [Candidatus Falkowbacteria bacterium]|nr:trigger factor [Candidatus Falkowbacteria bacterium]
ARSVEVPEAEIEKIIRDLREMRAKEVLVAREVGDGDKVLLDIEMFVDQVPVEGGQGKNTAIIIGKDYVIPGFDKKIIGARKDEVREFELLYPANFYLKNLAGKMVDFRVKINEVYARELPALDDEFASGFGLKKIAELQDNVKKSLTEQKKREAEQATEKEILEKIMEQTKFGDIPALLIEDEGHNMLHELEHNIKEQGADFNDYLASIKKTKDQLMLDLLPEAVKRIKISLLIREIGQQEKIATTATEIDEHIVEMKKHYHDKQEVLEKVETPEYRHYVDNIFTTRKVIEKLREWNIVD